LNLSCLFNTPQSPLWGSLIPYFGKGGQWGIFKINKNYLKIPRRLCGGEVHYSAKKFKKLIYTKIYGD
jgi:hypothetical protein